MGASSTLLALALASVAHAAPRTFYVAPDGSDEAPGTRAKPFRSPERARDAARAVRSGDIAIELAAGTYRLARPLLLGLEDSGRGGSTVTWRAAKGASVVLSGGRRVEGWEGEEGGRFRATVDLPNFRQLWVNGRRAQRARGPVPEGLEFWGQHEAKVVPAHDGDPDGALVVTAEAGYRVPDGRLADWGNPADVELGFCSAWTHMVCPFETVRRDGESAIIVMRQPAFFLSCRKAGAQAGGPAYIENALELLDEPGEWYFDRSARVLHYLPRPGETMAEAEVIAPALQTLLEVQGTPERPVHDVRFEGITFAHATWLRPSEFGHPDVQANFTSDPAHIHKRPEIEQGYCAVNGDYVKSPASVVVRGGRGIVFARCAFTALGGAGLDLEQGTQESVVEGCRFDDISASGMQVGDVTPEDHHPSDERRVVRANRITNNLVTHSGVEYQDSIGIFCGYVKDTVIAHNEVCGLPYTGISVGWGWGMTDAGGGAYSSPIIYDTPTVCGGNRIEYNHIHHVMQQRTDGGGIYTLSRQPGTVIRANHIHENGPGVPGGIYLDEGSADIEVTDNLVYGVNRAMNYNNHAQNRIASCNEHDNVFGQVAAAKGIVGKCLRSAGSLIEVPHAPELEPAEMTVEAWVRFDAYPTGWDPRRWAVCKAGNEWVDGNYSLYVDEANVGAYLDIGGGRENSHEVVSDSNPLPLGEWTPIAFTYDGETVRVYCNGEEVAASEIGLPRTTSEAPLTLGGRQDRYSFLDADLDEVRLYDRALSADELRRNAEDVRAGRAVNTEGLVRHWGFEDLGGDDAVAERIRAAAGLEAPYRDLLPAP